MKHHDDEFDDKQDQMRASEVAKHFGEETPKEKTGPDLSSMSKEEIEKWEKEQENSNDIYRISARVNNLARSGGGSLTPVGAILCNSHTHVLKALYDFADTLPEIHKEALIKVIRRQEGMPADVIAASKGSIRTPKK